MSNSSNWNHHQNVPNESNQWPKSSALFIAFIVYVDVQCDCFVCFVGVFIMRAQTRKTWFVTPDTENRELKKQLLNTSEEILIQLLICRWIGISRRFSGSEISILFHPQFCVCFWFDRNPFTISRNCRFYYLYSFFHLCLAALPGRHEK